MKFSTFNISDIIFKSIKGDLSTDEEKILNDWLNSSDANQTYYEHILRKESYHNKKRLYKEFEALKDYSSINAHIRKQKRIKYLQYTMSSAATILLCCLSWFLLQHNEIPKQKPQIIATQKITPGKAVAILETVEGKTIQLGEKVSEIIQHKKAVATSKGNTLSYTKISLPRKKQQKEVYNTLKIPRGGEYKLQLSDGTQVWLNSETMIKYPVQFLNDNRVVYVSGEAFFDVTPNKERPFIIKSEQMSVKVLGTTFNFRAYENEKLQQTTLVSGKVEINREGNKSLLNPSQQYSYNKTTNTSEVRDVDVSLYTSWKDGLFVFKSQKLEYILREIAKWYNVDFIYEDSILKDYVFSGRLQKYENANTMLRVFEETGDIHFKKQGKKIYVKKNKSN